MKKDELVEKEFNKMIKQVKSNCPYYDFIETISMNKKDFEFLILKIAKLKVKVKQLK